MEEGLAFSLSESDCNAIDAEYQLTKANFQEEEDQRIRDNKKRLVEIAEEEEQTKIKKQTTQFLKAESQVLLEEKQIKLDELKKRKEAFEILSLSEDTEHLIENTKWEIKWVELQIDTLISYIRRRFVESE